MKSVYLYFEGKAGLGVCAGLAGWRNKRVYVVGEGTKTWAAAQLGLDTEMVRGEEAGKADTLARFIVSDWGTSPTPQQPCDKILFPKGNLAKDVLVNILTENNYVVDQVVSYETVGNPKLELLLQRLDIPEYIVIFSPSGATASLQILQTLYGPELDKVKLIAIGPTTEAEIVKLGHRVSGVVSKPNPASLGQLLSGEKK